MSDNEPASDSDNNLQHFDLNDIHAVVTETLKAYDTTHKTFSIAKPTTLQGWLAVSLTISTLIVLIFGFVKFLNDIADHHKQDAHDGAAALITEMRADGILHEQDDESHISKDALQLEIQMQTEPIAKELNNVREGVIEIRTKVDILLERQLDNERQRRLDGGQR